MKKSNIKQIAISDQKVFEQDGKFYMTGYANTKGNVDSHGHRPDNYKGNPVYDLSRISKNPVCLVDHHNSASGIAGNFVELKEDTKGLWFKLLFRPLNEIHNEKIKDAVQSFITGFGKALSISGRWAFENAEDSTQLTKAFIYEISLVGIGSDPNALSDSEQPKFLKIDSDNLNQESEDYFLKDLNEAEKALKSGVKFSSQMAKTILSALKSLFNRDDLNEEYRDGVKELADNLKSINDILKK